MLRRCSLRAATWVLGGLSTTGCNVPTKTWGPSGVETAAKYHPLGPPSTASIPQILRASSDAKTSESPARNRGFSLCLTRVYESEPGGEAYRGAGRHRFGAWAEAAGSGSAWSADRSTAASARSSCCEARECRSAGERRERRPFGRRCARHRCTDPVAAASTGGAGSERAMRRGEAPRSQRRSGDLLPRKDPRRGARNG